MNLHPDYIAAFRGGSPPHPLHPASRAIDEQYVEQTSSHEHYRTGRHRETGDTVLALHGARHWFRRPDFVRLVGSATDERYRALAEVSP